LLNLILNWIRQWINMTGHCVLFSYQQWC